MLMAWLGWESLEGFDLGAGREFLDPGRLDVFVRGTDSALWHKWFENGWSGWEGLGGVLTSSPAAVSWDDGRIDVFVRGTDSALWHKWFENGWSGWESLGGILTLEPAVCSWNPGRLDVFVRGTDSALWHKWFENALERLESGLAASLPRSGGRARGGRADRRLSLQGRTARFGTTGSKTGGAAGRAWAVSAHLHSGCVLMGASGRLDVFAAGTDSALWHKWFENGLERLGRSRAGFSYERPRRGFLGANWIDCFVVGTDSALWHKWWALVPTVRLAR